MNCRSYFPTQPSTTSGTEPRSPLQRRPPASRSSHGIETHSGPPPALSTQRSYNADSPWRSAPSTDPATLTPKPHPPREKADDSIAWVSQASRSSTHDRRSSEPSKLTNGARPSSVDDTPVDSMIYRDGTQVSDDDEDPTLRMNGRKMASNRQSGHERDRWPNETSHEDLFLNLAREDSAIDDTSEVMSRSERRRVSGPSSRNLHSIRCDEHTPLSNTHKNFKAYIFFPLIFHRIRRLTFFHFSLDLAFNREALDLLPRQVVLALVEHNSHL